MVTLPYFLLFEFLGAAIEAFGIPVVLVSWALGVFSLSFFVAFLAVSVLLAMIVSISALLLQEYAVRRYERGKDMGRLVLYALVENLGYSQLIAYFRCWGIVDLIRRRHDWGEMRRRGLERPAEVPLPEEGTHA